MKGRINSLCIKTKDSVQNIWNLEKEKLLRDCLEQTKLAMVGRWDSISGFGTTTTKVDTENINGQLYCDILETELKRSMTKFLKKTKTVYQKDLAP